MTRRGVVLLCACGGELGSSLSTEPSDPSRRCDCRRPRSHLVEVAMLAAVDSAETGRDLRASVRIAARVLAPRCTKRGAA